MFTPAIFTRNNNFWRDPFEDFGAFFPAFFDDGGLEKSFAGFNTDVMEKDGNYVKLARQELKQRYQAVDHDLQMKIIYFFLHANGKQDKKWGEVREKWQKRGFANPPSIFDSWKK